MSIEQIAKECAEQIYEEAYRHLSEGELERFEKAILSELTKMKADHEAEVEKLEKKLAVAVEAMREAKDDVFNYYDEQGDVLYNAICISQKQKLEKALEKIERAG